MAAETTNILVTGANSGLGFAICCRLIDEFLDTRDATAKLCIIPTTRSQAKADDTVSRLQAHLAEYCRKAQKSSKSNVETLRSRVSFEPELLDLCNILSVQRASKRLRQKYERLDSIILNAGVGGWIGIDFVRATIQFFTQGIRFVSRPEFKIGSVGSTSPSQFPDSKKENKDVKQANGTADARDEPDLGEVFTANVFGHYLLVHYLMPLLSASVQQESSRVIWVGSLEAYKDSFSLDDFQGMKTSTSYEHGKRLTDLLVMTASAQSSKPYTDSYFKSVPTSTPMRNAVSSAIEDESLTPRKASLRASTRARSSTPNGASSRTSSPARRSPTSATSNPSNHPAVYISQPGYIVTDIVQIHWILVYAWAAVFYVARWCGSPWHNTQAYSGATAMTYLALAPKEQLDALANGDGASVKWGSATNFRGAERVKITEVEGLYDEKGVQASDEEKERFFGLGRECWKKMEEMRVEWEARLREAGFDEGLS